MSQGAYLTQEVTNMIMQIHLDNPDFGAKRLHAELLDQMKQRELDRKYGTKWPGVSVVGKVLKNIRERDEKRTDKSKRLDKRWSMASMAKDPLPPESLPYVLQVLKYCFEKKNLQLTVREVKWVAQLYALYIDQPVEDIYEAAHGGAVAELIAELSEKVLDLTDADFDAMFRLIDRPYGALEAMNKLDRWPFYDPATSSSSTGQINNEVKHERSHSKKR